MRGTLDIRNGDGKGSTVTQATWRGLTEVESLRLENATYQYSAQSERVARLEAELKIEKASLLGAKAMLHNERLSLGVEDPEKDIRRINGKTHVRVRGASESGPPVDPSGGSAGPEKGAGEETKETVREPGSRG